MELFRRSFVFIGMGRPPRLHRDGAIHHVMSRGNAGQTIFQVEQDWLTFLDILGDVKRMTGFSLYAYCLMSNHFHLLVRVADTPLSIIMQRLLTRYAKYVNLQRDKLGHIFQARFKSTLCDENSYFLELLRYIHLNPVRAGLVGDPALWPWSGHREFLGTTGGFLDSDFPLSIFSTDSVAAIKAYERFLREGMRLPDEMPRLPVIPEQTRPAIRRSRNDDIHQGRISLEDIAKRVERETNVPLDAIRKGSKYGVISAARQRFIMDALYQGVRPGHIAAYLDCSPSAISKAALRKRFIEVKA